MPRLPLLRLIYAYIWLELWYCYFNLILYIFRGEWIFEKLDKTLMCRETLGLLLGYSWIGFCFGVEFWLFEKFGWCLTICHEYVKDQNERLIKRLSWGKLKLLYNMTSLKWFDYIFFQPQLGNLKCWIVFFVYSFVFSHLLLVSVLSFAFSRAAICSICAIHLMLPCLW